MTAKKPRKWDHAEKERMAALLDAHPDSIIARDIAHHFPGRTLGAVDACMRDMRAGKRPLTAIDRMATPERPRGYSKAELQSAAHDALRGDIEAAAICAHAANVDMRPTLRRLGLIAKLNAGCAEMAARIEAMEDRA